MFHTLLQQYQQLHQQEIFFWYNDFLYRQQKQMDLQESQFILQIEKDQLKEQISSYAHRYNLIMVSLIYLKHLDNHY